MGTWHILTLCSFASGDSLELIQKILKILGIIKGHTSNHVLHQEKIHKRCNNL